MKYRSRSDIVGLLLDAANGPSVLAVKKITEKANELGLGIE
jgi:hypothetical protein